MGTKLKLNRKNISSILQQGRLAIISLFLLYFKTLTIKDFEYTLLKKR